MFQSGLTCNVAFTRYEVVKYVCDKLLGWKLTADEKDEKWDLLWTDNAVPPEKLAKMQLYQKINHFPGMYSISRKNYLAMNLSKLKKKFPDDYNFFPKTWLFPCDLNEIRSFIQSNKNVILICKPEASCQGRGIFLTKKVENIEPTGKYVVQEYMKKPFLIDNLKFDLRIYVLVTGCNPLRIFVHEEGLARFATEVYVRPTLNNIDEMCMHLTNYAVNKNNPNFIHNESTENESIGHKRSLNSVFAHLASLGHDIVQLKKQIDDSIIKTLCSIQPTLSHHYKSCQPEDLSNSMCFEILGFDIILDCKARPFVLEVNHTPSFTTDSPLDRSVKIKVIKDALCLLNLTQRERKLYFKKQKKLIMKRAVCGKIEKESKENRAARMEIIRDKRDQWENKHHGQFRKIFPAEGYQKFLDFADEVYQGWTGSRLAKIKRSPIRDSIKILNMKKSPIKEILRNTERKKTFKSEDEKKVGFNSIQTSPNEDKTISAVFERLSKPIIKKFKSSNTPILPPLIYYDEEKLKYNNLHSSRVLPQNIDLRRQSNFITDLKIPRLFNFQVYRTFDE